jgi:hypothetical protein
MSKRKKTIDSWETIRKSRDIGGKLAGDPRAIKTGEKLSECNVAASLTKEMSWAELDNILNIPWVKFLQDQTDKFRVFRWILTTIEAQRKNDPLAISMKGIVRSVMALYPLTLDTRETEQACKGRIRIVLHCLRRWLHRDRRNAVDIITILVHANQILPCVKSIMSATSRYRFIKKTISDKTNSDEAAKACKTIIQFAGKCRYQEEMNRLTVQYNKNHAVIAKTCRTAEFYRKAGLPVLCVTRHHHLRCCAQYEIARNYFQQCGNLPLFFVKLVSVTKSCISVNITDDHEPVSHIKQFLFGRRHGDNVKAYRIPCVPSTKYDDTATGLFPTPPYKKSRLLFESGLPAVAAQVQLFVPLVCAHIVIQYVQSTALEVISNYDEYLRK